MKNMTTDRPIELVFLRDRLTDDRNTIAGHWYAAGRMRDLADEEETAAMKREEQRAALIKLLDTRVTNDQRAEYDALLAEFALTPTGEPR
jgi:hypothetical protein